MSGRWWRAYSRARHDPKLLKLSDRNFRWWFNLVCVAADNGGVLPPHADLAVEFRVSAKVMTDALDSLIAANLFNHDDAGIKPHNWNVLQYVSDSSSNRVKQFRERRRNVSETPSENRDRKQSSEAKASGGQVPPRDVIFSEGLPWLMRKSGKSRDACAKMIGHWLKETGDNDQSVLDAMQAAEQANPADPFPWIAGRLKPKEARETWDQRRIREGMEAIRQ